MSGLPKYLLPAVFLLFILASGLDYLFNSNRSLDTYVKKLERYLHEQEQLVEKAVRENKDVFTRLYFRINQSDHITSDADRIDKLREEPFGLYFFSKDTMLLWTKSSYPFTWQDIEPFPERMAPQLIHLPNGYFALIKRKHTDITALGTLAALVPLKAEFALETDYLRNNFAPGMDIPKAVNLTSRYSNYPVRTSDGTVLCFLEAPEFVKDHSQQVLLLICYLLAFILLGILINNFSRYLVVRYKPWIGALFLVSVVFGLRFISIQFNFSAAFNDLDIFSPKFSEDAPKELGDSLGDLIINIILLVWMMVFFHREFEVKSFGHLARPLRFFLTILHYFSIFIGILMVVLIMKILILDSNISLDFENIFNLNVFSLLALACIMLLTFALFLFSHRLMLSIIRIDLSRWDRMIALVLSMAAVTPFLFLSKMNVPVAPFLLGSFIFASLFDLFIESKQANLTWLVWWLMFFSFFTMLLISKFNNQKDLNRKLDYARQIANPVDSLAEKAILRLEKLVQIDDSIRLLEKRPDLLISNGALRNIIQRNYVNEPYLLNHYRFDAYLETTAKRLKPYKALYPELQTTGIPNLFFWSESFKKETPELVTRTSLEEDRPLRRIGIEELVYLLRTPLRGRRDSAEIDIAFERKKIDPDRVYSELLLNANYKNLRELDKYEYAVFKGDTLLKNRSTNFQFKPFKAEKLSPGTYVEYAEQKEARMVYQADSNLSIILSTENGGYIKYLSLFSYLFVLNAVLSFLLAAINTLTPILPAELPMKFSRRPSLRNRIQLSVIVLILGSFAVIGVVTFFYFRNSFVEFHRSRLDRKISAIQTNADQVVSRIANRDTIPFEAFSELVDIANIHRIDIDVYKPDGTLAYSSEEDIFGRGIIMPRINPAAYFALVQGRELLAIEQERIGNLSYQSAYLALRNPKDQVVAYLGMPYYSERQSIRQNVFNFIGTLVNVYVFLLIITGALALSVANSITRPIAQIGEKLRRFKLGSSNEPLQWKSQDELGELIGEYNLMIKKLEEAAETIKQNAKEMAWREMARQIAHEIKNPLTPMKLSIQYLQHASSGNGDLKPLLKRVADTMIEQIENLSTMATNFSNFAKMPPVENEYFVLNEVVESVTNLFTPNMNDYDLKLFLPPGNKALLVFADKNQINRVLTNLVKNAIQALIDARRGQIDVSLYERDGKAVVKVSDNGSGIGEDTREKGFYPNFTTKSSGTGLGLAMCKDIVEQSQGKIYFKTDTNVGTDFYVELPIMTRPESED